MSDRAVSITLKVFAACFAVLVGWVLMPVTTSCGGPSKATACMSNLKQSALGALMYCADHDDRFPLATNWADAANTYLENPRLFRCSETTPGATGHAFYSLIAGRRLSESESARMPAVFDSKDGRWNASGDLGLLPSRPRHSNGTFGLVFADGHAVTGSRERLIARMAESRGWLCPDESR